MRACSSAATTSAGLPPMRLPKPRAVRPAKPRGTLASLASAPRPCGADRSRHLLESTVTCEPTFCRASADRPAPRVTRWRASRAPRRAGGSWRRGTAGAAPAAVVEPRPGQAHLDGHARRRRSPRRASHERRDRAGDELRRARARSSGRAVAPASGAGAAVRQRRSGNRGHLGHDRRARPRRGRCGAGRGTTGRATGGAVDEGPDDGSRRRR